MKTQRRLPCESNKVNRIGEPDLISTKKHKPKLLNWIAKTNRSKSRSKQRISDLNQSEDPKEAIGAKQIDLGQIEPSRTKLRSNRSNLGTAKRNCRHNKHESQRSEAENTMRQKEEGSKATQVTIEALLYHASFKESELHDETNWTSVVELIDQLQVLKAIYTLSIRTRKLNWLTELAQASQLLTNYIIQGQFIKN